MAKLILSMDGLVLKEINLSKERTTIGRKPHNDIQIDNLAVSGEHGVIVTILNDSFLEDLGSTNGTLVNGQPIKKHFLQPNDVIELGKYKLKYINEAHKVAAAADFEKTMVLRPGAMPKAPPPAAAAAPKADDDRTVKSAGVPAASTCEPCYPGTPGCHSTAVWRQCWQRVDPLQSTYHARQAWRSGRRDHPPPPRVFHHPRGRCEFPCGEWQNA